MKEKSLLMLLWVLLPVIGFSQNVSAMINDNKTANALPMELYYLRADAVGEQVMLEWASVAENHHDYFTVEHSSDGLLWENVNIVDGTKNVDGLLYYMSIDEKPYASKTYYRVKQTDDKKHFTYSKTVEVNTQNLSSTSSIFPKSKTTVIVQTGTSELSDIRVYNIVSPLKDVSLVNLIRNKE